MIEQEGSALKTPVSIVAKIDRYLNLPWLGLVLGILFFFGIFGIKIINPTNYDWIFKIGGDGAGQFVSWEFFRWDQWHLPLGLLLNQAYPVGSSLVYTDGIPLFALPFKALSPFLPAHFQFYGIWVLFCYALQGLFAWLIVSRYTSHIFLRILATVFFLLSPIMLTRMLFTHFSFVGHWTILAALYLYGVAGEKKALQYWMALIAITALVNAYLLMMVLALWVAYLVKLLWVEHAFRFKFLMKMSVLTLVILGGVLWLTGYFAVMGGDMSTGGFGAYSMNLLAPFNPGPYLTGPASSWSTLLRPIANANVLQYEGFNYFGVGVLLLIFMAIFELIKTPLTWQQTKIYLPLSVALLFMVWHALSATVTFASHVVFVYHPFAFLSYLQSIFRSSGRFFWPAYYSIIVLTFYLLFRSSKARVAFAVLVVALLIQLVDLSAKITQVHADYSKPIPMNNPMPAKFWDVAATQYKHLIFIPPQYNHTNQEKIYFTDLSHYAGVHRLTTNYALFSRQDFQALNQYNAAIMKNYVNGNLDKDSLYVISDPKYLHLIQDKLPASDKVAIVDGYYIIAPDWSDDQVLKVMSDNIKFPSEADFPLTQTVRFAASGNGAHYLLNGWNTPEDFGVWSDGTDAHINVHLNYNDTIKLKLGVIPYLPAQIKQLWVDVQINGKNVATWRFDTPGLQYQQLVLTPKSDAAHANGSNYLIHFIIHNPQSPKNLGLSNDSRLLGFGLVSAQVTQ